MNFPRFPLKQNYNEGDAHHEQREVVIGALLYIAWWAGVVGPVMLSIVAAVTSGVIYGLIPIGVYLCIIAAIALLVAVVKGNPI